MPMIQRSELPSAEQLVSRLRDLESRVSPEARRFHEMVRDLAHQSEEARGHLLPWVRKDEIQHRAEEVTRLEQAAPHLVTLFAQADSARQKIRDLRLRLGRSRNAGDYGWIEERCVSWEAALKTLGATLPRPSEVARARGTAAAIEASVDLHDDALEWLEKGRQVLRGLAEHGLELEGATLEADLPGVAEAFRSDGPSRKALDELASEVRTLEDRLSRQPQEAPVEYTDAARVLDRVEEWHHALEPLAQLKEDEVAALRDLRDRLETARRMWRRQDPEDADAVLVEARDLLERAGEAARSRRAEALHELRQQVRTLSQVAGSAEAEQEVANLENRDSARPQDHSSWWVELERTWTGFLSEAENDREELADRMTARGKELAALLAELSETPMREKHRSHLYRLEGDLREVGRSSEPREVLRDLQVLDRLREDAEALRSSVAADCHDVEEKREAVTARIVSLLEEARRAGCSAKDLHPRLRELSERDVVSSLEEAEAELAELEGETSRAETELVEACSQAVQDAARAVGRISHTLAAAGFPSIAVAEPPPLPLNAGVTAAADAVVESRSRQAETEAGAEAAWTELVERRDGLLARIGNLPFDSLRPGDRDDARRLAEDLRSGAWNKVSAPVERLELLVPVVARGDELFARLATEEDEARHRLAALRRRFDRSKKEGLHETCGELADRVESLLRGVPEDPVRWPPVLHQIDRAEELLARLEIHARRLAAAELGAAVGLFEEQRQREDDPEAEKLLAELAGLDPHELPPAALRRRIVRLAKVRGVGRRSHG